MHVSPVQQQVPKWGGLTKGQRANQHHHQDETSKARPESASQQSRLFRCETNSTINDASCCISAATQCPRPAVVEHSAASVFEEPSAGAGHPNAISRIDAIDHDGRGERPDQGDHPAIAIFLLRRRPHRPLDREAHEQSRRQDQPGQCREKRHHSAAARCRQMRIIPSKSRSGCSCYPQLGTLVTSPQRQHHHARGQTGCAPANSEAIMKKISLRRRHGVCA